MSVVSVLKRVWCLLTATIFSGLSYSLHRGSGASGSATVLPSSQTFVVSPSSSSMYPMVMYIYSGVHTSHAYRGAKLYNNHEILL